MSWLDLSNDKAPSSEPLPPGVYNLVVTKAEEKPTQKGDKRVQLEFSVADGEYAGRKIWEGYQLSGNPKAVEIGRGQLKALWKCAGHTDFNIASPEQLLNLEIAASVKVKEQDGYNPKNTISSFKPKQKVQQSSGTPF